jgi:yersiniabactin nonribosomal peptide synthetase
MYTEYLRGKGLKRQQFIRAVLLSGDWIPLGIKQDIEDTIGNCELYGLGGATEASIWSNIFKIDQVRPDWVSIPYGKPLRNQRYYIYNKRMQPYPNNVPGNLYIGGIGLADCYWEDKKNTAISFLIHPETKERLYKTGDLALYMPDGNILFCGRSDNQVKINGFRIELGEVDSMLERMEQVKKSVSLIAHNDIVTFIIATKEFSTEQAINELKNYLPDYMIPRRILFTDSIPLTWNGKVDRKKLLEFSTKEKDQEAPDEEMTKEEKEIAEIWKNILGIQSVKGNENFIAAGGDSLKALQTINAIQKR